MALGVSVGAPTEAHRLAQWRAGFSADPLACAPEDMAGLTRTERMAMLDAESERLCGNRDDWPGAFMPFATDQTRAAGQHETAVASGYEATRGTAWSRWRAAQRDRSATDEV